MKAFALIAGILGLLLTAGCEEAGEHRHSGYGGAYEGSDNGHGMGDARGYPDYRGPYRGYPNYGGSSELP